MSAFDQTSPSSISDRLMPHVSKWMQVSDVTVGGERDQFRVRYRGCLSFDSQEAYDSLAPAFSEEGLTLIFRQDGEEHLVLGVPELPRPRRSNPWINLLLFALTLFSMLFTGAMNAFQGMVPADSWELIKAIFRSLPDGLPFAISLLAILVAHESGHYIAARLNGTAVSLPYLIPFPGSPFGTMGAFIRLKEPPKNRRVLLDIGLAGPIAGLVVTIPVLLYGLWLSEVGTLPSNVIGEPGSILEGNSILYVLAKYLMKGELLPAPVDYGTVSPFFYWIKYILLGVPLPFGGRDVLLHPVAWAGWAGLLVTALNLIPAGQLDGGHLLYVLLERRAAAVWPFIILVLVGLGLVWQGWWLWAGLILLMGRRFAQPLDEITTLDRRRKLLAVMGLIIFVLIFMPVPLRALSGM